MSHTPKQKESNTLNESDKNDKIDINTQSQMASSFSDHKNDDEFDNDAYGDDEVFENDAEDDAFEEDDGEWDTNDDDDDVEQQDDWYKDPMDEKKQMEATRAFSPKEIDEISNQKVISLSDRLSLDPASCLLLLRRYKWNADKIFNVYFTDSEKILIGAGCCIDKKENCINDKNKNDIIECGICMEDVKIKDTFCLECGHINTCKQCWVVYLLDAVKTKQCVFLTCPTYKCYVTIPQDVWKLFLGNRYKEQFARYQRFCSENFIENSKGFCFCPGKSCDMIYSFQDGAANEVLCEKCGHQFCTACNNEAHLPSSCDSATKWLQKCSSEAENIQWILARTKRCPKCHVHIEKNQGCNHMTCRPHAGGCGHEFCWLCKGDWKDHGGNTGGYYKCNIYEKNKKEGIVSDEEKGQQDAKNELERYEFHYTRYDSHSKSSVHAMKQREKTEDKMQELADRFGWRLNEAQFLLEAVNEVIKCWHVLAWTYPIAYYLDDKEFNIELFKQQQGKLENFCDGLQGKLDFDLEKLGDIKVRQEMIGYTRTAQQYRKNLVEYIENEISF